MRNPVSWWGMHAALIGLHSQRVISLSGTPCVTSHRCGVLFIC